MGRRVKNIIAAVMAAVLLSAAFPMSAFAYTYRESGDYKMVALTFDDGPSKHTDRLLDALKERGAKATFFVVGNRVNSHQSQIKRIINEGHQLASHTYSHPSLTGLSYSSIINQLSSTKAALDALGGSGVYYLRPPYGNVNSTVKTATANMGVPIINWSVDSLDWQYLNGKKTYNHVMKTVKDGDIILLHDLYSTSVDAAIMILDELIARGYEFVTVEELLIRRGITANPGSVYYYAKDTGVDLGPEKVDPEYYDESKLKRHWAYGPIAWNVEKGIFSYYEDGTFGPNKYMTRGMFIKALGAMAGVDISQYSEDKPGTEVFSDVAADSCYAPYVRWAVESGIIQGNDTEAFRPEDNITRQQMAVCIERFLKHINTGADKAADGGYSATVIAGGTVTQRTTKTTAVALAECREKARELFSDADDIADWAVSSVLFCVDEEAFTGTSSGAFLPNDNATRAQGCVVMLRLYRMIRQDKYACKA